MPITLEQRKLLDDMKACERTLLQKTRQLEDYLTKNAADYASPYSIPAGAANRLREFVNRLEVIDLYDSWLYNYNNLYDSISTSFQSGLLKANPIDEAISFIEEFQAHFEKMTEYRLNFSITLTETISQRFQIALLSTSLGTAIFTVGPSEFNTYLDFENTVTDLSDPLLDKMNEIITTCYPKELRLTRISNILRSTKEMPRSPFKNKNGTENTNETNKHLHAVNSALDELRKCLTNLRSQEMKLAKVKSEGSKESINVAKRRVETLKEELSRIEETLKSLNVTNIEQIKEKLNQSAQDDDPSPISATNIVAICDVSKKRLTTTHGLADLTAMNTSPAIVEIEGQIDHFTTCLRSANEAPSDPDKRTAMQPALDDMQELKTKGVFNLAMANDYGSAASPRGANAVLLR